MCLSTPSIACSLICLEKLVSGWLVDCCLTGREVGLMLPNSFPPVVPLLVGTGRGGVTCSAPERARQAQLFRKYLLYACKGPSPAQL